MCRECEFNHPETYALAYIDKLSQHIFMSKKDFTEHVIDIYCEKFKRYKDDDYQRSTDFNIACSVIRSMFDLYYIPMFTLICESEII